MTAPAQATTTLDAATIAELNDLLQLDHDAVQSYTLAMSELKSTAYRETIHRYRLDHERHITELTALIKQYGGMPVELPHPTGVLKLGEQAAGAIGGGDTHVLVAFRNNERQARDKYARAAEKATAWPTDVLTVVRTAGEDERRHYSWIDMTVQSLGVTDDSALGATTRTIESVHAKTADAFEAVGKQGMRGFEAARRAVSDSRLVDQVKERPLAVAAIAVGVGLLLAGVRRAGASGSQKYY